MSVEAHSLTPAQDVLCSRVRREDTVVILVAAGQVISTPSRSLESSMVCRMHAENIKEKVVDRHTLSKTRWHVYVSQIVNNRTKSELVVEELYCTIWHGRVNFGG